MEIVPAKKLSKKKQNEHRQNQFHEQNTPPGTLTHLPELLPDPMPMEEVEVIDVATRNYGYLEANRSARRKRLRKDRSAAYRKIRFLEKELEKTKQSVQKYKKRCQRYKEKKIVPLVKKTQDSPYSKALQDTKGYNVPDAVKKTLVFHNALVTQIREN